MFRTEINNIFYSIVQNKFLNFAKKPHKYKKYIWDLHLYDMEV